MIKIYKYGEVSNDEIFARAQQKTNVEDIVSEIIANVRQKGDAALYDYCERFDKAKLSSLQVSAQEIKEAVDNTEPQFLEILRKAAANITRFHTCSASSRCCP